MFKIRIPSGIEDFHYNLVKDFVINNLEKVKNKRINARFRSLLNSLSEDGYKNLEEVIKAKPERLMRIYEEWRKKYQFVIRGEEVFGEKGINSKQYNNYFKEIFNYDTFKRSDGRNNSKAYLLTEKLNVRVCPYCNRQFIFTIIDRTATTRQNIIRPELDHYFPQSNYPMFALSFYNLIPCCHICNSNIKGANELNLDKHYHPYIDENKEFKFSFTKHATECAVIKFDDQGLDKAKETFDFFKLNQIYQSHNDEADKIDELYHEFDEGVIEDMYEKLNVEGFFISKKRLLDIVYGHYVVKDPDNEILGKLRNDIYDQIKKLY